MHYGLDFVNGNQNRYLEWVDSPIPRLPLKTGAAARKHSARIRNRLSFPQAKAPGNYSERDQAAASLLVAAGEQEGFRLMFSIAPVLGATKIPRILAPNGSKGVEGRMRAY
jgi:hypothetical protein